MNPEEYFAVPLPGRGLVTVAGPDRRSFLQGLISNDINLLDRQSCVYACLLNAQGKFLHDFFITEEADMLRLECEGGPRAQDLARRLLMYKLRANVEVECRAEMAVYAVLKSQNPGISESRNGNLEFRDSEIPRFQNFLFPDPRQLALGYRTFQKPETLEERPFAEWDRHRIGLTVPDGSRDMIPEKSTLLESNIDKLNGISWDKGCYTGQELTARMHYRGLAKKHLRTVQLMAPVANGMFLEHFPAPFTDITVDGNLLGEMRSSCGNVGLAVMKD